MKTSNFTLNLNLNSSTPLQALEAKAIKAKAIALVKAGEAKNPKKAKKPAKKLSPIEASIRTLERAVDNWKIDGFKIVFERGDGKTSACAKISLFSILELDSYKAKRQAYEAELKAYKQGDISEKPKEPAKPAPEPMYVFYPDPHDASRLGSVAIYSAYAKEMCESIEKKGYLFGHRVKKVALDFGRRLFVDVTLARA